RLIGGVAGVEAVAAVAVEREPGDRRVEAKGEYGAVVDIAVVGRNRPGDGRVLVARIAVRLGARLLIRAGEVARESPGVFCSMLRGAAVFPLFPYTTLFRSRLIGGVAGVEAVAAVAVEREPGDRRVEAVAEYRAVVDIAVVGRDRPGDGRVLVAR